MTQFSRGRLRMLALVAFLLVVTIGAVDAARAQAALVDGDRKPGGASLTAALMALDRIEDAEILGQPAPAFDPAIGTRGVRLALSMPECEGCDDYWGQRAQRSVKIKIDTKGFARGPLTVWALSGGHACVPGTKSKWRKWTLTNGDTFTFPLADKDYSTSIFVGVSDKDDKFRYDDISVRVQSWSKTCPNCTPAVIVG